MAGRQLRLLNMLKQNQPVLATFMMLGGMRYSQVLANTGLDAVVIDREHGYVDDRDTHDMVSAVAGAGKSPIIRIRGPTSSLIKRALDTGAHGLMVPMVNDAETARSIVKWAKFPPVGLRGQGSPFACFEHGLATPSEYVAKANESLVTMVQIESAEGLKNVDEICKVDGIDMVFIGPKDLALSLLGYIPIKYTEAVYLDAVDEIVQTVKRNGKKVGIVVTDGDEARK